jgi:beta-xylosidase
MAPVNPIIPGFAPDPSIVQIEGTFFLVNSSFHVFPGLPIYASKDLISWKHIGTFLRTSFVILTDFFRKCYQPHKSDQPAEF